VKVKATYQGSRQIAAATSAPVRLTVS
jgi:hypothetical protein